MSEALETVVVETSYPEGSLCASEACSMPTLDEVAELEDSQPIVKGDLVIFNLRGKVRSGRVISKGKAYLGIDTIGLQTNTKIPVETELVPVTVFVEKAVLDSLEVA
jgi:hypothetical protein